ncbi:LRR receptor-like serine/threonine-protein kinase RPK2 [Mercurialis annua]|uniref:LRR receptor-like serine/threonine-protein kinase RPK2 n=1 Tax=Mercurialis annua TaxID=3986 RepID=UPI00215F0DD4|nr:LRR receptor-like serine/threonine-protein kinase RPK2 [Mercurialis annua]XP_050237288.1 LRR receptor-like serine/threonine-protein kinase RPK2 [Mercurialis annua]
MSLNSNHYLLIIPVVLILHSSVSVADNDKQALLDFKSAITSDPLSLTSDWNPNDPHPCSWHGVTCNSLSRVIFLNLSPPDDNSTCPLVSLSSSNSMVSNYSVHYPCLGGYNGNLSPRLSGTLSPSIGKITQLRVLSLGFNLLSGELPLEIGQLNFLEVLDLGFNAFYGAIPVSLQNCSSLRVVNLSGNRLNGTLPEIYSHRLEILMLSFNLLGGSIPDDLGDNCGSLEHLFLDGNLFSGAIPSSVGNCSKLKSLILSSNLLQDDIPLTVGRLENLQVLDLSRNFLSGVIPSELGYCQQLKVVVLKNNYGPLWSSVSSSSVIDEAESGEGEFNYFEEELPGSITLLPNLRVLWAPNLNFEASFPQNWGSCSNLQMLNLAGNYFTGGIPESLSKCEKLYFLDLSSNNLTGSLPQAFHVPCMVVFNVSQNNFAGDIPSFSKDGCSMKSFINTSSYDDAVGFFSSFFYKNAIMDITSFSMNSDGLVVLHDLSNNIFTGPVPPLFIASESFSTMPFYGFWMDGNNLDGNISSYSFDLCRSLDGLIFDIGNNRIVGELPSAVGSSCKCMKFLSLAGNNLIGSVPHTFAHLDSLLNLNLNRNRLQGAIPSYIGQMKDLQYLSLSSNNFTGTIPLELAQLSALEVLELSFNSLSGEIPSEFAKLQHLNVLRLDHNHFSGKIPSSFGNAASLSVFDVSFNNLTGSVPSNSSLITCENVQGNPNLQPCPSTSQWEQEHSGNVTQQGTSPPSGSMQTSNGSFSPIVIATITSASVIFSVLLALVLFLTCMKKYVYKSASGRGPGRKEVVTCNDIGIHLTYENVVRATGGFNIQNCIGSGGFGATYKAEIVPGAVVAVKRLSIGRFQGVQQFEAEIRTLGRVQHPNLVKLIGYHVSESEMFLIYNYLPGGNLESFIQERLRRAVEWNMLHKIALDIARALAYLHDECVPRVLHRDIKPSNILLDNNYNAYLSDFGLARLLGTSETHATTDVAGTFGYVAPEYAMTCRVSDKADVYSYGVVLLELISDKKALDPSFSSFGNGFNIVAWASMLLRQGRASEFFVAGLWDSGPHDDLIEILHLGIMCTGESLSSRPSMRQVAQRLKRIQTATS